MMGPVQRITESIVHDALPLPKVGAVIGGKKVTSVKVSSTDRDYYTTGITLERGAKRKDIQAGLSELLNCHILNSQVGDLAVRVTHFEMIPTKKGPTIYVVMRIVPMVYNNPGKTELTAKEDFEKHYGPEFTAKNPKKWFREFAVKNPHGPAHRDKLWKFVGWVGESYGYCDKDTMYHRRASTIMPKIKITKAIDGANTFYHTHPSKDEPSLTSPDDYMLYFDLSQEPRNIRHFYTIMKDRIDYFKITPRKENRDAYVRIDQDKFLDEVDAKIDELMDKHSDDFPDDKQGGLNFCEKVTKQTVKWLNKKYGKYVKITYSCFYRVRKNPEETDFTNLHLGDSFIARAIADIRSGEYSWPSTDVNQMPQEKYAYWFGQYYFMDDDPEKQVGLLASQQEFESVGRVRDRTRKIGFLPGRLKGINHYLDLKIHEDYSNYDMMNLMNLHIDIMRLDSDVTDGGGVKTRLEELAKQLELPDEIRDNLIMIEEARILGAHTEEAKTLSGDFYMVLLLVDLCQRAVEVMDEVRAGTKTLEYAKYEIYAKLKEQAIRLLDVEISAYMNAFNQGKKSMRLNPPPRFKKGEFEAFIPPEYLQATGIVTEALEQYAPYQEGKPFLTGRNKVNMRVPSSGTVSTVMIGSLNTGNLQIIVPAKGHPMPDDAPAAALEAYQAVVNRLNEYGLNIPTEEQEVGSLTVSNPRKNNQLIIVAGPSGAGKSTTLRNLDKMLPNSKLIRSYVTRPKRKSDRSGEKNFVTEKQFKEMVAGGEFLEHAKQKSGDYYGKRLEDFKADADYLITEASLSGVNRLKKAFPGAYTVYLEPSESAEMIRKRLLRRGDMSPQMARGRSSKIPSHIKSSKMMPFDKRIITRQGKFDSIALEIMDSIPKSNPGIPFRVPESARPEMERRLTEMMMQPGYKPGTIKDAIAEGIYDDEPSNFSYAQGEYDEFLEEIEKGDMDEAFAEYSDVEGHVAYWNYTNHGIEVPIYNTIHLDKTRKRVEVFANIFADFGLKMDSKYLKGGSNFQKTTKVRLALETAAQDQGVPFNATDEQIRDSIAKAVPDVVMENPSYPSKYYNAHLYASRSRNNFFPGDVPVAPPDLLRGNPPWKLEFQENAYIMLTEPWSNIEVPIDERLAPLVQHLWSKGVPTSYSDQGIGQPSKSGYLVIRWPYDYALPIVKKLEKQGKLHIDKGGVRPWRGGDRVFEENSISIRWGTSPSGNAFTKMDGETALKTLYKAFGLTYPTSREAALKQVREIKKNPPKLTVRIQESTNPEKKLMAVFTKPNGRTKTTHFGARGMSDYTQHKDPKRKDNYLARHGGMGEDWKDPTTAGALSRWILWGKPSLRESFNDYKKKFRLEGVMAVTNTRMNPVKAKFLDGKAQTLVFVKPRGLNAWLQIKRLLPGPVLKKRWVKVDRDLISTHYEEHKGKPHFNRLVDYYDGQWVLALIVGARYDAVRAIIGSSKPEQLKEGEIRKVILDQYGDSSYSLLEDWTSGVDNGIHASDSVEAANRELRLWFDSPIGKPPKFLNLSSHPVEEENDDNFHPFAGLTVPVDNWNMCAELVVDFYEAMPWLPGWIKGKEPPILLVGGVTVLVILNIYVFKALVGKDPVVQGGNPFSEEDPLPEAQRLRLNKLIEDLRRRRPSLVNPKAPGYNSYAWTTQDWRSIKVNNKGEVDYSKKCGAEDTQVADGTPRLCLPAEVVRTLIKSKNGKEILLTQARKKARAAKGQRVPWHPRIKEIWKRVEDKTVKDRPNPPRHNFVDEDTDPFANMFD